MSADDPRLGTTVVHRRYVSYAEAHYAGSLVDGAWGLGLFGDVATELCIVTDGDEGLFASYDDVQFRAPVRAGDVLEITATLVKEGTRSRVMDFAVHVVGAPVPELIDTVLPGMIRETIGALGPWLSRTGQPNFVGPANGPDALERCWPDDAPPRPSAIRYVPAACQAMRIMNGP